MSQPKRHHYLPRFYLAGFTDTGEKDGFLTVFHLIEHRTFRTRPENVGVELHFNRVDLPGVEPDAIEKALTPVEARMAAVLREVASLERLPKGEDLGVLINLIALLFIRNPQARNAFARSEERLMRVVADLVVSTPDTFASVVRQAREAGVEIPEEIGYDEMRTFVRGSELRVERDTTRDVFREIKALDSIIEVLAARKWSLLVSSGEAEFICCDHPVTLTSARRPPHPVYPFGLAEQGTIVVVPLSKRMALWGELEGPHGLTIPVDAASVAGTNRTVLASAVSFAYASSEAALIQWDDGRMLTLPELMAETRQQQKNPSSE